MNFGILKLFNEIMHIHVCVFFFHLVYIYVFVLRVVLGCRDNKDRA